jgi:CBS-domain-containing membrane protein
LPVRLQRAWDGRVREDADFKEMVSVMRSRRISAFPVIDASTRVVGVASEADLLFKETITGSVERRTDALSLLATIRHLEGVIGVRDRLSYPGES